MGADECWEACSHRSHRWAQMSVSSHRAHRCPQMNNCERWYIWDACSQRLHSLAQLGYLLSQSTQMGTDVYWDICFYRSRRQAKLNLLTEFYRSDIECRWIYGRLGLYHMEIGRFNMGIRNFDKRMTLQDKVTMPAKSTTIPYHNNL